MASNAPDYFTARPISLATHTRTTASTLAQQSSATPNPSSPRTPLLNRSTSSAFGAGSPGSFRIEQEETLIYELGSRHFSAGWSGESRPRCIHLFPPEDARRVGDYRDCDPGYRRKKRRRVKSDGEDDKEWGKEWTLYSNDLRSVDLGLLEDRLERVVRRVHTDYLQLDQKPRKAVLVVQSLLPMPVVEVALRVLFNHYAQPPTVVLLTSPMLVCVGAGLRDGLILDIGWEETVVTAVGEYKEVVQKRSVRAGRMLTMEMRRVLEEVVKDQLHNGARRDAEEDITFEYAEEVTRRMAWCRQRVATPSSAEEAGMTKLPSPDPDDDRHIHIPFTRLSKPAETTFLGSTTDPASVYDDQDLPLPQLAYRVLLSTPLDLRALCTSRIIVTGGPSNIPGLKPRLLQDIEHLIETRSWDLIQNYGSATAHHNKILQERSVNVARIKDITPRDIPLSPAKKPIQDAIPHAVQIHDDTYDPISRKIETEMRKGKPEVPKAVVRMVQSQGAWAGASMVTALRAKGAHEVERSEFLKNGLADNVLM